MADEADIADEQTRLFIDSAINFARKPVAVPGLVPGKCLNCEAPIEDLKQRYCDHSCAEDHRNRVTTLRKQGLL